MQKLNTPQNKCLKSHATPQLRKPTAPTEPTFERSCAMFRFLSFLSRPKSVTIHPSKHPRSVVFRCFPLVSGVFRRCPSFLWQLKFVTTYPSKPALSVWSINSTHKGLFPSLCRSLSLCSPLPSLSMFDLSFLGSLTCVCQSASPSLPFSLSPINPFVPPPSRWLSCLSPSKSTKSYMSRRHLCRHHLFHSTHCLQTVTHFHLARRDDWQRDRG